MEISADPNFISVKTIFDESLDEYESIDIASFLLEFDRLYSTACYFLKSTDIEHSSDIRSDLPKLTQQLSDYIDNYAISWLLSEMDASSSNDLNKQLNRLPDFAPISTPLMLQEGVTLKITQVNYNSPFQITFKGSFAAMILAVTLLGGEISASTEGFSYKTEGIIECIAKLESIFFSANTQEKVNEILEERAAAAIQQEQKGNFSEGER
ncbi:TPA: hypothetical protein NJ874_004586 [Vibrio parahaemolyticus]|nr:hypothetical protein [Vibrio parahaemolyticus]HCG7911654.1 hypothetical protein [Vibrio parahaemolyticus]